MSPSPTPPHEHSELPDGPGLADVEIDRIRAVLESRMIGPEAPHLHIGRFVVLKRVGAGAMGLVYAAYDPELDRQVAVKLLRTTPSGAGSEGRLRLLREAQSLAKLAHPNVVAVHEVGEHDGQVFVAMEYIEGQTLRAHWSGDKPPWRQVLECAVQAGRGLAAAHAVGLVHRDFKPDNVIVGADGRVRVLDFGLARIGDGRAGEDLDETRKISREALASPLTVTGQLVGTPAYMAPEQLERGSADAFSDQFSFCAVVWEGVYGRRPFAGETLAELLRNVRAGVPQSSARSTVPAWVRAALATGLAAERAQRWRSLDALLDVLERGQARSRRRKAVAAVAGASCLLAGAWAWQRVDESRQLARCAAAGAEIQEVWSEKKRAQVSAALSSSGLSYSASTAEKVTPWLDAYAESWERARTDTCIDEYRYDWTPDLVERGLWCLDERRIEIEVLVDQLLEAEAPMVERAVTSASGLTRIETCRDAALLSRLPGPPAVSEEVRIARTVLSRAGTLERSGRYDVAIATATEALAAAQSIDWPPLTANARARLGSLMDRKGDYAESERLLEEAYFEALNAGATELVADCSISLSITVGQRLRRMTDGTRWSRQAEAALRELGEQDTTRWSRYFTATANLHFDQSDYQTALDLHRRALEIRERTLTPGHPHIAVSLNNLGNALWAMGDYEQARAHHRRALDVWQEALGPEHPDVAMSLTNLASVEFELGATAEAVHLQEQALAIDRATHGDEHPDVALGLQNLAAMHYRSGDLLAARESFVRALATFERSLGPAHPKVAISLSNLAAVESTLGNNRDARRMYERALGIWEGGSGEADHIAAAHEGLAGVHIAMGETAEAEREYSRGLELRSDGLGPTHPDLIYSLLGLADIALESGRPADALVFAERALALRSAAGQRGEVARATFALARALWELPVGDGQDRTRSMRLAREALDRLREQADELSTAKIEAWLAARSAQ